MLVCHCDQHILLIYFALKKVVSTLLSRDSKASEVEDLDVFIPVEVVVESDFPLSTP